MLKDQSLLQYLHQTLGVHFLSYGQPDDLAPEPTPVESLNTPPSTPDLVFVNYDSRDINLDSVRLEVFEKMVKAMGVDPNNVWRIQGGTYDFPEVLNRLRTLKIQAPVIVMKTDPEIFDRPQQTGVHPWAECFSVSAMQENAQLKKATWKVLQYFIKKG